MRKHLGLGLAILSILIFSTTLPVTRHALGEFSPWFITHIRALVPGLAAIPILLLWSKNPFWVWDRKLIFAGILLGYGFPGFSALALQTVDASHGGVILGIQPLLSATMAALIAGERPSLPYWLWSILGAILVVSFALQSGVEGLATGDLWLPIAALCAAIGYVMSAQMARTMPGWEVICRAMVFCLPFSITASFLLWPKPITEFSTLGSIELIYIGLFPMFIGFFAWNAAMAREGIAKISQVQLLQPFFTLIISAIFLSEGVTWRTIAFALSVTITILMARRAKIMRPQ